jgi:methyl-accepting chemotaxis protein
MARDYKRRKKFIRKDIQLRLITIIISYLIVFSVILSLIFLGPSVVSLFTDISPPERQAAVKAFLTVHGNFWPATILVLYFVIILALSISHKIAGPIYRFEEVIKAMEQGDLSQRVRLRRGDYFFSMMDRINAMTQSMKDDLSFLKTENGKAEARLSAIISQLGKSGTSEQEVRSQVEEAAKIREAITDRLAKFRLEAKDE